MPKATVNKNNCLIFGQHDIRFTRQCSDMQPKPKALTMQQRPQEPFGARVSALDLGHCPAAAFRTRSVHPDSTIASAQHAAKGGQASSAR